MAARRSGSRASRSKAHREFISEAEEILERMRSDLADFQDQRATHAEVDPELVNRVFRAAHSLKGLAGMFELEAIGELAHHLEDVLDGLRLGRIPFESPATGLLEEAVELVTNLLEELGDPTAEAESGERVRALVARIEAATEPAAHQPGEFANLDLEPSLLLALTEYEEHRLRENLRRGRYLSLVDATFEIIAFEEGLAELSSAIREVGEVVSTLPSPGDAPESQIRFSLLVATGVSTEVLSARLEFPDTSVRSVRSDSGKTIEPPSAAESSDPPAGAGELRPDAPSAAPAASEGAELESLKSISDTVRVDIRKLDELMNLVGELVIQRGALEEIASKLAADPQTSRAGVELSKVHKLLDRKLKELQSGVLDVRMVPLRQIFEKLSRVARRLRRDLRKDVYLEFKGADTELDKLIAEQLIDPLVHLVRNAFDHAIESDEERTAAGKSARGTIRIDAHQRGNHVVIELSDDGRGIDVAAVRAEAESISLVSSEAVLSEKETLDLLFTPGFSTRQQVTETSGRGVGLDVVRANLTDLGGVVEISTRAGSGTTIALTLPITLAIIQVLLVGVKDQRYAIPLNSVLETMLVDAREIQTSEGREMLNLRGEPLLLRRLADEFGLPGTERAARQFVVVLGLGEMRMGLLVDSLQGQQDTVIKPILGPVQQVRGIAGATEVGEQGAVLVLDVSSLVEDALRRKEAA